MSYIRYRFLSIENTIVNENKNMTSTTSMLENEHENDNEHDNYSLLMIILFFAMFTTSLILCTRCIKNTYNIYMNKRNIYRATNPTIVSQNDQLLNTV
jgi:hypothetical protein